MLNPRYLLLFITLISLLTGCSGSDRKVITVAISGTVLYEDKQYDDTGFTGTTAMKPVRHARVELVGDQGVVAETATDDFGTYTLSGKGSGLFVRVLSQTDASISHGVEVVPPSSPSQLYAVRSAVLHESDNIVDINLTLAGVGPVVGVFNILDVYQSAGEFTAARWSGHLPSLQIRWEECNANGTFSAKPSVNDLIIIFVFGVHADCEILQSPLYSGNVDTDEYDDDVLWHEYGHYLEFAFDTIDSPGVTHSITDTEQDMRLAWSEGWSDFLSGAIKEWLLTTYPERLSIRTAQTGDGTSFPTSLYVDTRGSVAFRYDFRSGTLDQISLDYATSEGAIAKILWGINDDALFDFSTIWQVFTSQLTVRDGTPSNLEKVWNGWLTEFSPPSTPDKATMRAILSDRQVYYDLDASESDNSISEAKPLRTAPGDFYTLFFDDGANQDFDLIPFTVVGNNIYRVETYDLHNGADTNLRILDASGSVIELAGNQLINDNHQEVVAPLPISPNDTCRFSSRLEFSAPANGTYYAEVTSIHHWDATGHFGDYQLLITENPSQSVKCP